MNVSLDSLVYLYLKEACPKAAKALKKHSSIEATEEANPIKLESVFEQWYLPYFAHQSRKKSQEDSSSDSSSSSSSSSSDSSSDSSSSSSDSEAEKETVVEEKVIPTPLKRKSPPPQSSSPSDNTPKRFCRIDLEKVEFLDERLRNNTFVAKGGDAEGSYGAKAHRDLIVTKGKGFTKEKNKKKRGSYKGGQIDFNSHSIKFEE
jgi:hypothetical protein